MQLQLHRGSAIVHKIPHPLTPVVQVLYPQPTTKEIHLTIRVPFWSQVLQVYNQQFDVSFMIDIKPSLVLMLLLLTLVAPVAPRMRDSPQSSPPVHSSMPRALAPTLSANQENSSNSKAPVKEPIAPGTYVLV